MKRLCGALILLALLSACGSNSSDDDSTGDDDSSTGVTTLPVDTSRFDPAGLAEGTSITEEDCTLSGGTKTRCYRITVQAIPTDHEMGPYCPTSIDQTGDPVGGIWEIDGTVYQVDGPFITDTLPSLYGSDWQLWDPTTGLVRVTDPTTGCAQVASQETSGTDPSEATETNYCIVCATNAQSRSYIIPVQPVVASQETDLDTPAFVAGLGLGFNGVPFFPPEPVDRITMYNNIAPLDDCGGHGGFAYDYHYHRSPLCTDAAKQTVSPQIGYALDGFAVYGPNGEDGTEPTDLDACLGHTTADKGYHYHASSAYPYIVGCLKGEYGCVQMQGSSACDATQQQQPPSP